MASCARREPLEETGLPVDPGRIAFVLEALRPDDTRRVVDLVFLAALAARREPGPAEEGFEAVFVPLNDLPAPRSKPSASSRFFRRFSGGSLAFAFPVPA